MQKRNDAAENRSTAVILTALAMIFTLLVKTVDVQAIGPNGSEVGFAAVNGAGHPDLPLLCRAGRVSVN